MPGDLQGGIIEILVRGDVVPRPIAPDEPLSCNVRGERVWRDAPLTMLRLQGTEAMSLNFRGAFSKSPPCRSSKAADKEEQGEGLGNMAVIVCHMNCPDL